MIKIISAFIAGAFFGVAVICCLMAAKNADEQTEQAEQISREQSEDTDAENSGK